ncbi:MAG: hypothetical protein QHC40_02305 [Sphingobium sp.]|nr:hypothetical protein [Sphingobium sp.]
MKKVLKRHGSPEAVTTDGLRSYSAAMNDLGNREKQEVGHIPAGYGTCSGSRGAGAAPQKTATG